MISVIHAGSERGVKAVVQEGEYKYYHGHRKAYLTEPVASSQAQSIMERAKYVIDTRLSYAE